VSCISKVAVQTSEVLAEDSGWLKQEHEVKVPKKAHIVETSEVFATNILSNYDERVRREDSGKAAQAGSPA